MSFSWIITADEATQFAASLAIGTAAGYAVATAITTVTMYAVAGALLLSPATWIAMTIHLIGSFLALLWGIEAGAATYGWVDRHWDEVAATAKSVTNWVSAKLA